MYVGILVAIAFGWTLLASAQPATSPANPRRISLQECLELALSRNLDLQIEQLSAEIAKDDLWSAYGVYVPNLTLSARRESVSMPADFDPQKANIDFPFELKT